MIQLTFISYIIHPISLSGYTKENSTIKHERVVEK